MTHSSSSTLLDDAPHSELPHIPFSVIIPVHRGGPKFLECLASVAAAIRSPDEIVVVADGEGDGSWRKAEQFGARVVKLPTNRGPSCARNLGAKSAHGDILFFVDADVAIPPDALHKIESIFQKEPDLAALIGSYDEEPGEENFLSQFKNLFHHYVHQFASSEASTFWGACGAIRREVFLGLGGFDENYARPSIEDIELGYRLRAASHRIRLVRDLQVKHLKRWSTNNLVRTDFFDRAAPWTELIWDQMVRRRPRALNDLNLGVAYRISVVTSFLLVISLVAALFTVWSLVLVPVLAGVFIFLHLPLFHFFGRKRGYRFVLKSVLWRFGYDIYSGLGFCYGSYRFAHSASEKILTHVFAKLDAVALGTATGALGGLIMLGATLFLVLKGGPRVGANLSLAAQFFPGYSVTGLGALVGLIYGAVCGFLCGFSIALVRNTVLRIYLGSAKVKAFLERVHGRPETSA